MIEVQGSLHFKTWRGRVAVNRMKKDEVKRNCLEASGYTVLAFKDTEIKKDPEKVLRVIYEELGAADLTHGRSIPDESQIKA